MSSPFLFCIKSSEKKGVFGSRPQSAGFARRSLWRATGCLGWQRSTPEIFCGLRGCYMKLLSFWSGIIFPIFFLKKIYVSVACVET
jgi:hypothetical protein